MEEHFEAVGPATSAQMVEGARVFVPFVRPSRLGATGQVWRVRQVLQGHATLWELPGYDDPARPASLSVTLADLHMGEASYTDVLGRAHRHTGLLLGFGVEP